MIMSETTFSQCSGHLHSIRIHISFLCHLHYLFMWNFSPNGYPSWKFNKSLTGVPKHKHTNKRFNVVTLLIFRERHKEVIKYTPQLRMLSAGGEDITPCYVRNVLPAAKKRMQCFFNGT